MKVGLLVSRSGPAGLWAPSCDNGAMLALAKLNAAGGVFGREIRIVLADAGQSADESLAAGRFLETYHDAFGELAPPVNLPCKSCYDGIYFVANLARSVALRQGRFGRRCADRSPVPPRAAACSRRRSAPNCACIWRSLKASTSALWRAVNAAFDAPFNT